jgi:O-methyltransferase
MTDLTYTTLPAPASVDDCHFYHWLDIPGHGEVSGDWDLRGDEPAYLGGAELAGRRVLEIGPASGHLTFHMETRGAEVVAVELAPGADWDIVPHAALDLDEVRAGRHAIMDRLRSGFWFAHERFGSRARVHYGSAYDLPESLGRFDLAVMANVLLHLRDPLRVVESCAARADRLVITDRHHLELDGLPVQRLFPAADSPQWDTWWDLGPDILERYLGVLGFRSCSRSFHTGRHTAGGNEYPIPLFTVVAEK